MMSFLGSILPAVSSVSAPQTLGSRVEHTRFPLGNKEQPKVKETGKVLPLVSE